MFLNRQLNTKEAADFIFFTLIGLLCLGYVLFRAIFAELCLQIPFLDFPVFIGEIVIAVCFIYFLITRRHKLAGVVKHPGHSVILLYFILVIFKALYGYAKWGPLALRDAALFYYPLCAIFTFHLFNKKYFNSFIKNSFLIITFVIFILQSFFENWLVTLVFLQIIIVYSFRKRWVWFVYVPFLFLCLPYSYIFNNTRMMMLANFSAMFFFFCSVFYILPIKKSIKALLSLIFLLVLMLFLFKTSDKVSIHSMLNAKSMIETFHEEDVNIMKNMSSNKPRYKGGIKIYTPNNFFDPASHAEEAVYKEFTNLNQKENVAYQQRDIIQSETPNAGPLLDNAQKLMVGSVDLEKENEEEIVAQASEQPENEDVNSFEVRMRVARNNVVFRLFIWRDMLYYLGKEKPFFGFDFGIPLRSFSLEVLEWGITEWGRDGWITAHNSYLYMIYRFGIIGIMLISYIFVKMFYFMRDFIRNRSVVGIALCSILIIWFIAANFLGILELPYTAIPIWSIFGITLAYHKQLKDGAFLRL